MDPTDVTYTYPSYDAGFQTGAGASDSFDGYYDHHGEPGTTASDLAVPNPIPIEHSAWYDARQPNIGAQGILYIGWLY